MLKISTVETRNQRRLVLEGKLIAPWADELKIAYAVANSDLNGRELVIDLKNLTTISPAGENVLVDLMKQRVKVRCCGVFTKYVLKQLTRRMRRNRSQEEER